jgi:hypothetical protein
MHASTFSWFLVVIYVIMLITSLNASKSIMRVSFPETRIILRRMEEDNVTIKVQKKWNNNLSSSTRLAESDLKKIVAETWLLYTQLLC